MKYAVHGVIGCIIAVGAFYGGTVYQKQASASERRGGQGQSERFGGLQGQRFAAGRGANGMNGITGTILSKDDQSLTIKLPDGSTKIVLLSKDTKISKAVESKPEEIKKDESVTVIGQENDGTIRATLVRIVENDFARRTNPTQRKP